MRHAGQKDMECNICQKSFVTKNALFRHQRFHTGEKPFPVGDRVLSVSYTHLDVYKRQTIDTSEI